MKLIISALILSILFESTLTTLPLCLLIIIFAAIATRQNEVFVLAFFAGAALDILKLGTVGLSSAYFVAVVAIIFAYQKKFEINSLNFASVAALTSSFGYLFFMKADHLILQVAVSTLIISIPFFVFKKTNKTVLKYA